VMRPCAVTDLRTLAVLWVKLESKMIRKGFEIGTSFDIGKSKSGNYVTDHVEFEFLGAVVMKCSISWNITPCSPLKINRRFEGTSLCFLSAFTPFSCSSYSSTRKM
jgi:hypothetical protein